MAEYVDSIVSFIDVLGFKKMVEEKEPDEIIKVLERMKLFTPPNEDYDDDWKGSKPYAFTISDAIVRVRPIDNDYNDGALFYELYDLYHAQIELIGKGIFVRGGITIGKAHIGENGAGPVFGKGLIKAYEIESEKTEFPIISLDKNVMKEFKNDKRLRSSHNTPAQDLKHVKHFLKKSDDKLFLDYLGQQHVGEFDDGHEGYNNFLLKHEELIHSNLKKYSKKTIRKKYEWLQKYHNRTVGLN